jgi:hypothetical protein
VTPFIQPTHVLPGGIISATPERFEKTAWIELGFAGFDPKRPFLFLPICDDSVSVRASGGADPLGNRYAEMGRAIRTVADMCMTNRTKVAITHFDVGHGASGVVPLGSKQALQRLAPSLRAPVGGAGSSALLPAVKHAEALAAAHPDHDVVLAVASDFQLLDDDPAQVFDRLRTFPGHVHAIVLGGIVPPDLLAADLTVTTVEATDPPGKFAAAIHRSLTATRRGARYSVLHTPRAGKQVLP